MAENVLGSTFRNGSDLKEREPHLLETIEQRLSFHPRRLLSRSTWWGSDAIGAFLYEGTYKDTSAALKVQGMKPTISEIDMLEGFAANQSLLVRPPKLLAYQRWSDHERYEAMVIELITGPKLITGPTTSSKVQEFFSVYSDYRQHCRNHPWLEKPTESLSTTVVKNFKDWQHASNQLHPAHPHRLSSDQELIAKGIKLLQHGYYAVEPEFQHKHLSTDDVFKVSNQYVLTSNFMWGWGAPLADAVFAYHWFPYIIGNHFAGLQPNDIDKQKSIWLQEIWRLPTNKEEEIFIALALLERCLAGLVIDSLTIPLEKPLSKYLVDSTRKEVQELIDRVDTLT